MEALKLENRISEKNFEVLEKEKNEIEKELLENKKRIADLENALRKKDDDLKLSRNFKEILIQKDIEIEEKQQMTEELTKILKLDPNKDNENNNEKLQESFIKINNLRKALEKTNDEKGKLESKVNILKEELNGVKKINEGDYVNIRKLNDEEINDLENKLEISRQIQQDLKDKKDVFEERNKIDQDKILKLEAVNLKQMEEINNLKNQSMLKSLQSGYYDDISKLFKIFLINVS